MACPRVRRLLGVPVANPLPAAEIARRIREELRDGPKDGKGVAGKGKGGRRAR